MNNFIYQNPVRILFGKEQIAKLNKQIPKDAKVLLTYGGGSIFKNGVYAQVTEALKGFNVLEFGGIEPNPKFETLMKAVELCREENINYLLAVGGGSVLDGTKFIAAAVNYPKEDCWEILNTNAEFIENVLPIGSVMTLPATGSEMNANSVVSRLETSEKLGFSHPAVMPQFSILDPECIYSLPDKQIANGIIDSFVHVMEQYLTYPVNSPLQDRFSESILLTLIEEGPKVLANKKDYDAAANYMLCATLALNGLIAVGVPQDWSTHMIGHELTAFFGLDHAQTLAIVLPGVMNIQRDKKEEKLLQYGERIWGISAEGCVEKRVDMAISKTISFFEQLGVKTRLSDYAVPESGIVAIENRFKERARVVGEHSDIDGEKVATILRSRL